MDLTERDERRFYAKVALPNAEGCMLWLAHCCREGYGRFRLRGRLVQASRVSYTLAYGPIPEGLQVDHVKERGCTHRHCVAQGHLEAVTQAENIRRGSGADFQRKKTHCPQGHPYAGENLYVTPDGRERQCRECVRTRSRLYARRKRALTPMNMEES